MRFDLIRMGEAHFFKAQKHCVLLFTLKLIEVSLKRWNVKMLWAAQLPPAGVCVHVLCQHFDVFICEALNEGFFMFCVIVCIKHDLSFSHTIIIKRFKVTPVNY